MADQPDAFGPDPELPDDGARLERDYPGPYLWWIDEVAGFFQDRLNQGKTIPPGVHGPHGFEHFPGEIERGWPPETVTIQDWALPRELPGLADIHIERKPPEDGACPGT